MPISYKLLPVNKPGTKGELKTLVRPSVVIRDTLTPDMFIDKFSQNIKFSKADLIYFMYSLQEFLVNELKEGNIVQTGAIGTFYPVITTIKGENTNTQHGTTHVEPGINYRPTTEMIKELRKAKLEMVRT